MKSVYCHIVVFFILLLSVAAICSAQSIPSTAKVQASLLASAKQFNSYARDFNSFAKSNNSSEQDLEYEVATSFADTAKRINDRIFTVIDLLDVYDAIKCKADRKSLKLIIEKKIKTASVSLDQDVEEMNTGLGSTKSPAIAVSATRMKDDLRSLKSFLVSIILQP